MTTTGKKLLFWQHLCFFSPRKSSRVFKDATYTRHVNCILLTKRHYRNPRCHDPVGQHFNIHCKVKLNLIQIIIIKPYINLLHHTGYVMHQQFNIQQLYALPTLYLCVLYLSENKQRLVPLTA